MIFTAQRIQQDNHLYSFLSSMGLLWLAYRSLIVFKHKDSLNYWGLGLEFASLIFMIYIFGHTYGLKVRDVDNEKHEIVIRGLRLDHTLRDAVVVFITSHHTVIKVASSIVALPSSDVAQIIAKSAD